MKMQVVNLNRDFSNGLQARFRESHVSIMPINLCYKCLSVHVVSLSFGRKSWVCNKTSFQRRTVKLGVSTQCKEVPDITKLFWPDKICKDWQQNW